MRPTYYIDLHVIWCMLLRSKANLNIILIENFIIFRLSVWKDLFWRRVLRLISVTYLGKPWRQVFSCMVKRNNILDLIYLYTSLSFANEELWCNCKACVNCKCACRHGSHPGACTALFFGWISLNLMVIPTEYKTVTTHKMK